MSHSDKQKPVPAVKPPITPLQERKLRQYGERQRDPVDVAVAAGGLTGTLQERRAAVRRLRDERITTTLDEMTRLPGSGPSKPTVATVCGGGMNKANKDLNKPEDDV